MRVPWKGPWTYERTKHIAIVTLILAVVFTCIEIGLVAGAARRRLTASAEYDESLKRLIDSGASAVDHVDQAAAHLDGVAATAESKLPGVFDDFHTLSTSANGEARALQGATGQLQATSKQVGDAAAALIEHSDASVNQQLVPRLADAVTAVQVLVTKYGLTADEATKAIGEASEKSGKTIDELTRQIADPRWGQAADNLVKATGNANDTLADFHTDLHETMRQMPHTMAQVDRTATNIAKFSRVSIIAGIISNLANGLIPGLVH